MDAEKLTQIAITMTRTLLAEMIDDPVAMAFMTFYEINPEEVEDKVSQILHYLDKTAPEEAEGVE